MNCDIHIPPQSTEAEMSVLGSIFLDLECINIAYDLQLVATDFYKEEHRKIFDAMTMLSQAGDACDLVLMVDTLKQRGQLEEVGGAPYLLTLIDYVPTSASMAHYCKIVKERSIERRLIQDARAVIGMIQQGQTSQEVIASIESSLVTITNPLNVGPVGAHDLVMEAAKRVYARFKSPEKVQGISWGLESLDNKTNGIHRGELIIVAGRPSMGKTAFADNILRSACACGLSSAKFSLEMPRADVMDRIAADRGNIKLHHLRSGRLTDVEWSKYARVCEEIKGWKLHIDDTPGIPPHRIKSACKRLKKNGGLDLVVVDYLQLMGVPEKENRVQSIGAISRGLKQLARELDIAVILLSQLNRAVDGRPDKRPLMSDLRDSGEIEQDADVIILPFRPAAYCQKCRDKVDDESHNLWEHESKAEIIIEKQRNGERNISVPVAWLGMFQRFEPI